MKNTIQIKTRNRALRECLQHEWETPRLIFEARSKLRHPINVPWSKLARDYYFNDNFAGKLVLEHTRPIRDVTEFIIKSIRDGAIKNANDMLKSLRCIHKGPVMVVLTKDEDKNLIKGSYDSEMATPLNQIIEKRYINIQTGNNFTPLQQDCRYCDKKQSI